MGERHALCLARRRGRLARLKAFRCFEVKLRGGLRPPAVIIEREHGDRFFVEALANGQLIAHGHGFSGLGALALAVDLAALDGGLGLSPGAEEAGGPKPFI